MMASDHEKATRQSSENEKLKAVLENAGGICHNLNQPLQYVLGAIQIILLDISPTDPNYAQLDTMREKIEEMGDITRKLAECIRYRS
jgi:signal transduction histidine kinase